jgi:hypothetical protein
VHLDMMRRRREPGAMLANERREALAQRSAFARL